VRSHYTRYDIQRLFELQPRQAQQVMKAVSVDARVGNAGMVTSEALQAFLERLAEAENPAALLRARPIPAPRRSLRQFIAADRIPATLDNKPSNLELEPGRLSIPFSDMEQLVGALQAAAEILDNTAEFARFEELYVPPAEVQDVAEEKRDLERARAEVEKLERSYGINPARWNT